LLVILGALLAINGALLVSYNVFYDDRLQTLLKTRADLGARFDEARRDLQKAEESERRLADIQVRLEDFFSATLGSRRERLAPLIEEIYSMTRKAKLRPKTIDYSESDAPGAEEIRFAFALEGPYAGIKGLLAGFEASPSFLVVEGLSVNLNEDQPDVLRVSMSLVHYFRPEAARKAKKGRASAPKSAAGGPPQ
jgi:hypothetical protein